MDSWTTKAGFPYINITRISDNRITVTQERFLSNGQKPADK
jgi:aminopeptidase N